MNKPACLKALEQAYNSGTPPRLIVLGFMIKYPQLAAKYLEDSKKLTPAERKKRLKGKK